ncbi:type II toxin-antitoxin system toxin DNA ADP-ribosyl transferase DarT [Candidatus Symbiobacter mobilis]|uniref:DarT domain-containing protein n=1 Tax=Candidatus Symbiobacter mobilis CR TaxID=946483 RepID=U5NA72_9BURK|nr:DUF4433 domain-containing protein [Candidatus Symbiobacter mobilis]AGX88302.1 hypothetical protein Cenrod_2237 [Candidatus Symbiobacter mobilis CR]
MPTPAQPKIYHICHVNKLPSILQSDGLFSDAKVVELGLPGTVVGMSNIKQRRLTELRLDSHPNLFVGQCVPFYFCPRSVMLYLMHVQSAELAYKGGQDPIIHLQADLYETVAWAKTNDRRWAFTLSNGGSRYFEDRADLAKLHEVNWDAVHATNWKLCKEEKQSEFLVEEFFPWCLVQRIGVANQAIYGKVQHTLHKQEHKPTVEIKTDWYY